MTAIHHIYANRSNVGDWLSAQGMQHLLGKDIVVRDLLCDEPFMPATRAALDALPDGAVVLVGGGGLVMDYFTPLWEALLSHSGRLTLALWGLGVVDLKRVSSLPPRRIVRAVASAASVCAVRDPLTAEVLDVDCAVTPCASLVTLMPAPRPERASVCHAANYTTVGGDIYDTMVRAATSFCAETGRIYRETNNRIEPDRADELMAVLSRYHASDLVLSSRLHGCLIAFGMNRPVLAVSGDRKIEALFMMAGLTDWVLGQHEAGAVRDRLHDLPAQPPPVKFLRDGAKANAAVAAQVRNLVLTAA